MRQLQVFSLKNDLLIMLIIFACGCGSKYGNKDESLKSSDSLAVQDVSAEIAEQAGMDSILLFEDRIGSVRLPFRKKEMLSELGRAFKSFTVTKEIGQQDGPDFPLYSVRDEDTELCFFAMDYEDTTKLNKVYIKQSFIKDQYGLKVGDSYQKIKQVRPGVKTFTDYHQHTIAYFDGSNIMYEISGDVSIPDTADFENLHFTEDQLKDWTIEYLIWGRVE